MSTLGILVTPFVIFCLTTSRLYSVEATVNQEIKALSIRRDLYVSSHIVKERTDFVSKMVEQLPSMLKNVGVNYLLNVSQ